MIAPGQVQPHASIDSWRGASSHGVSLTSDDRGFGLLVGRRYRRVTPYPAAFLQKLSTVWRGPALVEDLLISEEPGRFGRRVELLIGPADRQLRVLHWGAGSLAATIALARLGFVQIEAVETNPLWRPLQAERSRWADLGQRIRLLAPEEARGDYDLLFISGDTGFRHARPSSPEIIEALARLRPGGTLVLVAWPMADRVRPWTAWNQTRGSARSLARLRILHPRGPAPSGWPGRIFAVIVGIPLGQIAPRLLLSAIGERYECWEAPAR